MNLTFDEWKAKGFHVRKGEKGSPSKRKDNKFLFSEKQVEVTVPRRTSNYYHTEYYDREDCSQEEAFICSDYYADMGSR